MTRQQFDELTAKGVVILDGATGSNLRKAGMPVGISSEQWVLENPSVLQELQRAYVDPGTGKYFYDLPETAVDRVAVEEGFLTFFRRILQEGTVNINGSRR